MKIDAKLPPAPKRVIDPMEEPQDKTYGLGALIKEVRQRRGYTQKQVAEAVGLERTSITNIEGGNQLLTIETLVRLAHALDMELTIKLEPRETPEAP